MALKKIKKNELYKEGSAYKESQERIRQQNEEIYKESKIQEKMDRLFADSSKNNKQKNNTSNQNLLLPILNRGKIININNDSVNNLANMSSGKRVAMIHSMTNNQKDLNKLNQEVIQYQQQKESEEKAKEINEDMSNGKYGSAIGHILSGVPQKALDSTSTTFASMNSLVAPKKINATMSDENELLKTNRALTSKYEKTTNNINNDIVKTASNVSGTIGGMLPSIISNIALPGSGAVVQGVNVGADAYQDTLNEDASNKLQATTTGIAKGTVSGLIEKITGGNLVGKGSLDDVASNFIANRFKGKIGQKLASKAYEMIGEIGEENLENQAGYIIDKIINGKDITAKEWWNEATETTKNTFLTTVVLNLLGLGGNTYNEVKDINSQKYLNEAKEIINNENLSNNITNLQQNATNNDNNLQTQQTIQKQNQVAKNGLSEQINNNIANSLEILYNNSTLGETKNISIDEVLKIQNRMGYRTEEEINNIREYVKQNGLQNNPIELVKRNDGTIEIEDGNHRLLIAKELGMKEIPIKFVESWENIGRNVDTSESNLLEYMEVYNDTNNRNSERIDRLNEQSGTIEESSISNRNKFENRETTERNDRTFDAKSQDNGYSSNNEIRRNIEEGQQIEDSNESSFSMQNNTPKTIQEAGAPIRKTETNLEKYNKYKKNILDSRAKEVNNLITYKNETIRNIENKIAEKQALLNSKKDKNTKTASVLRTQIENLKTRQQRIDNLYNEKIDKVNSKTNRDKINFETRNIIKKEARENLKVEISPLTEDLTKYKDKKAGILFKRETAQRNIDDIVQDKELAEAIKETIFDPVQVHQAQKTREVNELFNKINELNLDKTKKYNYVVEDNTINGEVTEEKKNIKIDEATLAQLLIEKKLTNQDLKNNYNMSNEQIQKINQTANTFTEILDYLYNRMNEEQIKYGYSPIGKLNNYFPHFFENKPDTMLGKIASYFGIDITNQNLPTEIAGKTDIFKPGKTWNSNTLQRKTNKTDYDALKAMEKYIQGATDIIYTTEDIQKIREYERQIRYQYSDKGIQEEIDKIMNDKELTQEAKDSALEGIFKNTENELSNFVTWLNDYGNALANKKSFSDRSMERDIGRNLYSSMSGIEARIASNTIGGNLSVSLTNFAPLFQASGTTKMNYLLTGMLQTTANNIKGMTGNKSFDFVDNSNFLTNRFGTDSISEKTFTQKISDVASIPMNVIDEFTAESIVRGKYLENINKGMTEEQALDNADKYAAKIMADRSKGALPLIFNAKNPISKLTTMFQVEPNNIISNYLKDMPREATSKTELTKQATKLMVASYAFNTLVMAIRGGNEVLPDPIRWVSYLIKSITGDDDEKEQARTDLMESIIGSVPFTSNVAGLFGFEDIGRVPISNAMPNLANIVKIFDGEADSKYRTETAIKEILKPLIYLGLPTGGAQIKKTIEGISTVSAGGSYKTDKEGNKILQFPVENPNAGDYIRAGILGKYSLPMAKEYQNRNFKSLSAKQTKTYEESNLPFKEYLEYIDKKLKTNEDKINYLSEQDWNENQKWGIYINDIFSSTERKKDGGSQLSDAKYITSNGVSKTEYIELYNKAQKNNIDMPTETEYKEMKNNGITLKTYIDYKEKIAQETIKQRSSGNLKEDGSLKDKDKMSILINSMYSNKEKQALYENYIKEKEDSKYDIIKTVSNFNINSYLEYKIANSNKEFKADTKDDGTLSGKTISGSAKNKKFNYISNMKNTPYMQKAILFGLESTPNKSDKAKIVNYITTLSGKTNKEKLKMLDQFTWVTIYKDGSFKY